MIPSCNPFGRKRWTFRDPCVREKLRHGSGSPRLTPSLKKHTCLCREYTGRRRHDFSTIKPFESWGLEEAFSSLDLHCRCYPARIMIPLITEQVNKGTLEHKRASQRRKRGWVYSPEKTMRSIQCEECAVPIKYFQMHNYNCNNEWQRALQLAQCHFPPYSVRCFSSYLPSN